MIKRFNLICVSFNGEYVKEREGFETIKQAWEHSNEMGSRWFFFPFHFVTTEQTIKDAPPPLEWTVGKRIKTILKRFKETSQQPEAQEVLDAYEFALLL